MYRKGDTPYQKKGGNPMIHNDELLLRGLASYYGMTIQEFYELIGGDVEKLKRFYYDFIYNHN